MLPVSLVHYCIVLGVNPSCWQTPPSPPPPLIFPYLELAFFKIQTKAGQGDFGAGGGGLGVRNIDREKGLQVWGTQATMSFCNTQSVWILVRIPGTLTVLQRGKALRRTRLRLEQGNQKQVQDKSYLNFLFLGGWAIDKLTK